MYAFATRRQLTRGSFVLLLLVLLVLGVLALFRDDSPGVAPSHLPGIASAPPPRAPEIVLEVPRAPVPPPRLTPRDDSAERAARARATPRPGAAAGADEPDRRVRVHLVIADTRGKKVGGALVSARNNSRRLSPRRSTGEGDLLLDPVSPDEGSLLVTIRHARFGKQTFTVAPVKKTQTLKLAPAHTGPLSGTILTTENRAPQGPIVVVTDHEGVTTEFPTKELDVWDTETGRFELDLAPDTYRTRAHAGGYCPSDWSRTTVSDRLETSVAFVLLRAGKITGRVNLPPDLQATRTIVVDLEIESNPGPAGASVEGRKAKLGAGCEYALGDLRPGWFRVRACDSLHDGTWATVQLREGEAIEGFTLFMEARRSGAALHGCVTDPAGEAVPEATVTGEGTRTLTDDHGNFILRIDREVRFVTIEKEGFESTGSLVSSPEPGQTDPQGVSVTLCQLE